ncbi:GDP-mannose 4,6-dehydratase [Okeanomitos corallinicola TIOX110]|uniref:GDP-mannose 4,6-dehydratase n=1 Tax=Okeanomitos corallinicola TIOX110 TaxID=3133117 RepID=A0ABZ2UW39_9CYAN
MNMNYSQSWVVTGAAGFLGSHVVEKLLNCGESVIGIDNFFSGSKEFIKPFLDNPNFIFYEMDIRDVNELTVLFQNHQPSIVVHLAAIHFIPAAVADPTLTVSLNVHGTQCVLTAARVAGVKNFWFASTGDVYKPSELPHQEDSIIEPFNIYGLTKLMGEQLLKLESKHQPSAKFVIGRLFNLYGVRETNPHIIPEIIQQIRQQPNKPLFLGNLWPLRDMVPVEEAASAVIESIQKAPIGITTVNIASGVAHSMEELIEIMGKILGKPIEVKIDPAKIRSVERSHLQADVSKLKKLIGWTPHSDVYRGLKNLLMIEDSTQENLIT